MERGHPISGYHPGPLLSLIVIQSLTTSIVLFGKCNVKGGALCFC